MEQPPVPSAEITRWNLNRILVLLLTCMFAGLGMDLRYEHVDVVHEHAPAWIPIIYSGVVVLLGIITLLRWTRAWRLLLLVFYAAGVIIGGIGVYLHNDGHVIGATKTVLTAWSGHENHDDGPPKLAPGMLSMLGVLGVIITAERLQERKRN